MAFRAETKRLRGELRPGEQILASDILAIKERPDLTGMSRPVLVVTDLAIFVMLSGRQRSIMRIDFDELRDVGRKSGILDELQLIHVNGDVLTFKFDHRDHKQLTADLITERFFGRVIKDTAVEFPSSD
jgi:hypothetical protein